MNKNKEDVTQGAEQDFPIAGFGHALHLLLMAIAKTNPSVGSLLDEFTAMHADYLQDLRTASGGELPAQSTDNFVLASRLIYRRLSDQLERQQANQRCDERVPASASIH